MSQQKTLTKLEKANDLRAIRKRLGWTQPTMARALGLDFTYLSQLETGKREVDDWYLQRAREIAVEVEKSKNVKGHRTHEEVEMRARCHAYLDEILDGCRGDLDQITWAYVELQRRFPRPQPPVPIQTNPAFRPLNSVSADEAAASVAAAEQALELERKGSRPSGGAGGPTGHKPSPSQGTSGESKDKRRPPGPAPK